MSDQAFNRCSDCMALFQYVHGAVRCSACELRWLEREHKVVTLERRKKVSKFLEENSTMLYFSMLFYLQGELALARLPEDD